MAISIQGTPIRTGFSTSRSPGTGSIASYTPATNDIIATWARAGTTSAAVTIPSGWVNVLGGTTVATATGSVTVVPLYHIVTSAEATAVTTSWTLTNLWNASQTGALYTIALRGVDSTTPVDDFSTSVSSSTVTPHVLPGLTGANLVSNSLVLSCVTADTTTTYGTAPTGWTFQVKNGGGQNAGALLTKDALTTGGTTISDTNISPGSSAFYASATVAYQVPQTTVDQSAFFAMF
jgi:hypothetical protein